MTIEKRDSLLGSYAVLCQGPACAMEFLGNTEADAELGAKQDGWKDPDNESLCPDCVLGHAPAAMGQELEPAEDVGNAGQRVIDVEGEDSEEDEPSHGGVDILLPDGSVGFHSPYIQPGPDEDTLADGEEDLSKPKKSKPRLKRPFHEKRGDDIPGVTASSDAEDQNDVAAQRRKKRQAKSAAKQNEKTLAAMGGVDDLLKDFDGVFGNQSDPDKW